MVSKKISELGAAPAIDKDSVIVVNDAGVTYRCTAKELLDILSQEAFFFADPAVARSNIGLPATTFTQALLEKASGATVRTHIDASQSPLDEDDFASNSATRPSSQRAAKAYADEGGRTRMRISFDGTASPPTINSSYNVASITDNGTGDYTINFTTAMADTNYTVLLGFSSNTFSAAADPRVVNIISKTTASLRLKATIPGTGSVIDLVEISAMIVS